MPTTHLATSTDLPGWAKVLALVLALVSLGALLVEMRRRERGGLALVASGVVAAVALLVAVLRPVRIAARESVVGARVVVLADASRSMSLPGDGSASRQAARDGVLAGLPKVAADARLAILGFGEGAPRPLDTGEGATPRAPASDLTSALRAVAKAPDERPAAVVVVSDGRLDEPGEEVSKEALKELGTTLRVPIHTVAVAREVKPDASIRRVAASGAAVAHVPLPVRVEIGCVGGLPCEDLAVTAKELRDDGPPALLASGTAKVQGGKATLDMTLTLERAGSRIVELAVASPQGDSVPENDRRLITFNVRRERVRVLHVAGRPTNDTRSLRQWLKSDASVDIVAFFILRTNESSTQASTEELNLIPFPVDELFSEHLPSFDAVVLQDFDAPPYHLERHLPTVARYVRSGGGLIMVGGEKSFASGGYVGTPLASVLPVQLAGDGAGDTKRDLTPFVPTWTEQGRAAPLLGPLRALVGEELPAMPGANVVGDVQPGAVVLWTHPSRVTRSGAHMPILAIGDQGDGRSIALAVDGGWMLQFSALGARTAGRGYGALWDGLLGWLMRDPRYEPAQIDLASGCTAGLPSKVRVHLLPASAAEKADKPEVVTLDVARLDRPGTPLRVEGRRPSPEVDVVELTLPALEAGGYTARLRLDRGQATRRDFACEAGGDEWADARPDPARLEALAKATGGTFVEAGGSLDRIPFPKPTIVSAERHVVPVLPPWAWSLGAACLVGLHWIVRRRSGLS